MTFKNEWDAKLIVMVIIGALGVVGFAYGIKMGVAENSARLDAECVIREMNDDAISAAVQRLTLATQGLISLTNEMDTSLKVHMATTETGGGGKP